MTQPLTADFIGASRYQGSSIDIGAYEYGGSAPPPTSPPTTPPSPTPVIIDFREPDNPQDVIQGLTYQYYQGSWQQLPDFNSLTPLVTSSTSNFNLDLRQQEDNFAFRFTGYISVPQDGIYTFYLNSDDESKLFIGSTQVTTSNWNLGEHSGTVGLKAGKHSITVLYYEYDWNEYLEVGYSGPNINKQSIPDSALYRKGVAAISGDGNGDGQVDGQDFIIWLTHYGQYVSGTESGDYNDSGKVEIGDYISWVTNLTAL